MSGLSLCWVLRVRFTDTSLVEKVAIFVLCVPDFEQAGILDLQTCGGQKAKLRLGKAGRRRQVPDRNGRIRRKFSRIPRFPKTRLPTTAMQVYEAIGDVAEWLKALPC